MKAVAGRVAAVVVTRAAAKAAAAVVVVVDESDKGCDLADTEEAGVGWWTATLQTGDRGAS